MVLAAKGELLFERGKFECKRTYAAGESRKSAKGAT